MRGLFFTGTDTDVGKTYVMALVARLLRSQGRDVRVSKPLATGAQQRDGRWLSDDTVQLAEAAGETDLTLVTPFVFREPAAPPVAARLVGQTLTLAALVGAVRTLDRPGACILVEGVGGFLCPVTETATVADLACELGFPIVVVARRSLGTLNHTLLTLEAIQQRGLKVAGLVVNETSTPQSRAEYTNVEELQKRVCIPLLAVVPFGEDSRAPVEAVASVNWWHLASGER